MKVTIEHKDGEYVLLAEYRYSNLTDALYGQALLFEPHPQKTTKPKNIIKVPKEWGKFPLGNAILKVLNSIPGYVTMDSLMSQIKTPRPYRKQIWSTVLAKLVKNKKIKKVIEKGEKMYGGMK